ncbi:MAG: hypothetical protein LBC18_04790 [Opitutaceae bacterium]|jgi:hypothetical protein|nr:hypothetical protein [Opitutaceae bacterium]
MKYIVFAFLSPCVMPAMTHARLTSMQPFINILMVDVTTEPLTSENNRVSCCFEWISPRAAAKRRQRLTFSAQEGRSVSAPEGRQAPMSADFAPPGLRCLAENSNEPIIFREPLKNKNKPHPKSPLARQRLYSLLTTRYSLLATDFEAFRG